MNRCETCGKRIWFSGVNTRILPKDFDREAPNLFERVEELNIPYSHYHNNRKCYPDYEVMQKIERICKKYNGKVLGNVSE